MVRISVFLDLHGVLVDTKKLSSTYRQHHIRYIVEQLNWDQSRANAQYDLSLKNFFTDFRRLKKSSFLTDEERYEHYCKIVDNFPRNLLDYDYSEQHAKNVAFFNADALKRVDVLYPEVTEAVQKIHSLDRVNLYIASHATREHIIRSLKTLSFNFKGFFGHNVVKALKTSREYYERLFALAETSGTESIVVGNSSEEIIFPKEMGAKTIVINRETKISESVLKQADAVLPSLEGLDQIIEELQQK